MFRELKSQYALTKFETGKKIVRIWIMAALLTLVVSRAILRALCDHAEKQEDGLFFVTESWAETLRSAAQLILQDIAAGYGYPPPNVGAFLY